MLRGFPHPKLIHSVGFGVGGTRAPGPDFARDLTAAVDALDACWVSFRWGAGAWLA